MEHFISKIQIKKLRHLENIDIILSDNQRKHLLLTGKNGSGNVITLLFLFSGVPDISHDCLRCLVIWV